MTLKDKEIGRLWTDHYGYGYDTSLAIQSLIRKLVGERVQRCQSLQLALKDFGIDPEEYRES